jgi:hypothetical protein
VSDSHLWYATNVYHLPPPLPFWRWMGLRFRRQCRALGVGIIIVGTPLAATLGLGWGCYRLWGEVGVEGFGIGLAVVTGVLFYLGHNHLDYEFGRRP